MGADDVVAVAAAVYAVPPGEFVEERKRRAAEARQGGDRDLAARIGALPKPSASAALVNRLAHDAGDDLMRVLRLGGRLRAAQEAGDAAALRTLTAERRHLLDEVAASAADRAEQDGRRPGAAVLEELQQTLQAAMAGDAAAAAVRSGRLVRALSADGLEPADLRGAVAPEGSLPDPEPLPEDDAAEGPGAAAAADTGPAADADARRAAEAEEAERRRRAEAERRAARARKAADEAAHAASGAWAAAEQRTRAADEAREQVEALRVRLGAAEERAHEAERAADTAREASATAAEAAERARAAAEEAEEALGR